MWRSRSLRRWRVDYSGSTKLALGEADMFFRKPKTVVCAACGKPIEPNERRFVDKNRMTKVEQHTHLDCPKVEKSTNPH